MGETLCDESARSNSLRACEPADPDQRAWVQRNDPSKTNSSAHQRFAPAFESRRSGFRVVCLEEATEVLPASQVTPPGTLEWAEEACAGAVFRKKLQSGELESHQWLAASLRSHPDFEWRQASP